jgi:hypothetical protein
MIRGIPSINVGRDLEDLTRYLGPSGTPLFVPSSLELAPRVQGIKGQSVGPTEDLPPRYIRRTLSIPQISLGQHRANRLRDYDVTSYQVADLATMSRWNFEGILDQARVDWHRATKAKIAADLDTTRRLGDVAEIATSNRWGARL